VITREAVQTLGPTFRAIFALVDDGTLPRAAENAAQVLESIANEPNQRTLRALVALSDGKTVTQVDDVLAYMARSANLPEFEDMIEAVAAIGAAHASAAGIRFHLEPAGRLGVRTVTVGPLGAARTNEQALAEVPFGRDS